MRLYLQHDQPDIHIYDNVMMRNIESHVTASVNFGEFLDDFLAVYIEICEFYCSVFEGKACIPLRSLVN